MKKYINGEYIEMTTKEIADLEADASNAPEPVPTLEEEIAKIKAENAELRAAVEALISGSTGGTT
ncbi:MAG: hypothetical protein VB118_04770 [Oscillospiraceae bacterium]|nr:hypothetical protein [Oscillospiraceae bacterium]